MTNEPMPTEDSRSAEVQPMAIHVFKRIFFEQWQKGFDKYGTDLKTFNGRDAGNDALQELADAVAYVMQLKMENTWLKEELKRVSKSVESNREENCGVAVQ